MAIKADWHAIWAPKAQMPPKKMGMTRETRSMSSWLGVKMRASSQGNRATMAKAVQVTVRVTVSSRLKVWRTRR